MLLHITPTGRLSNRRTTCLRHNIYNNSYGAPCYHFEADHPDSRALHWSSRRWRPRGGQPANAHVRVVLSGFAAGTNWTASPCALVLSFDSFSDASRSRPRHAQAGKPAASQRSADRVVEYWLAPAAPESLSNLVSIPTKLKSLSVCSGLRKAWDSAIRALKCTPLVRLSSRNLSNLAVRVARLASDEGEPGGGDGGMSRSGTVGRVSWCSRARLAEYGDDGGRAWSACTSWSRPRSRSSSSTCSG